VPTAFDRSSRHGDAHRIATRPLHRDAQAVAQAAVARADQRVAIELERNAFPRASGDLAFVVDRERRQADVADETRVRGRRQQQAGRASLARRRRAS